MIARLFISLNLLILSGISLGKDLASGRPMMFENGSVDGKRYFSVVFNTRKFDDAKNDVQKFDYEAKVVLPDSKFQAVFEDCFKTTLLAVSNMGRFTLQFQGTASSVNERKVQKSESFVEAVAQTKTSLNGGSR